jgi:hypothetical protein
MTALIALGTTLNDGTGDVARTAGGKVNSYLGLVKSISTYVPASNTYTPAGNGTTDDTSAIQSVLNSLSNGQTLVFQHGASYAINASGLSISGLTGVTIDFNGATFLSTANQTQQVGGAGAYMALFLATNCTSCTFANGFYNGQTFLGAFIGLQGCTDCKVLNNDSTNATGECLFASGAGVRNVWAFNNAHDSGGSGIRGFWLGSSASGQEETDLTVYANKAINNTATGFAFGPNGARIIGNFSLNNQGSGIISGGPVSGSYSRNQVIVGNTCRGNSFYGWQIDDGLGGAPVTQVTIADNVFDSNVSGQMLLYNCSDISVTGNTLIGTSSTATINIGASSTPHAQPTQRLTFGHNLIIGGSVGVLASAGDSAATLTDLIFIGNTVTGAATAYSFSGATAGQIARLILMGNSGGSAPTYTNTTAKTDSGNSWN